MIRTTKIDRAREKIRRERIVDREFDTLFRSQTGAAYFTATGFAKTDPHFEDYVAADHLAKGYQKIYVRSIRTLYSLAPVAVALAAFFVYETATARDASLPGPTLRYWMVFLEAVVVTLLALLVGTIRWGGMHRSWLDYRLLAELIRTAMMSQLCGVRMTGGTITRPWFYKVDAEDNVSETFEDLQAAHGQTIRGITNLDDIKAFFSQSWVMDQAEYHRRTATKYARRASGLELWAIVVFALDVAFVWLLSVYSLIKPQDAHPTLKFGCLVLPGVGACLMAYSGHREYERLAFRYDSMRKAISALQSDIEKAQSLAAIEPLVRDMQALMLEESKGWRVLVLPQAGVP